MAERTHLEYKELRPRANQVVLVLAAHADDEVLGALSWLLQCQGVVTIAFLTNGTPSAPWRPKTIAEAEYRHLRRREAQTVWRELRPDVRLAFAPYPDQRLVFCLSDTVRWLRNTVTRSRPNLMLTPAFEGGHPDHDACNLLASFVAAEFGVEVWEYALYTVCHGSIRKQEFPDDQRWTHRLDQTALAARTAAMAGYRTQTATLTELAAAQEAIRPLPRHDYCRPALAEPAAYERWGFPVSAEQVARACSNFLAARTACAS